MWNGGHGTSIVSYLVGRHVSLPLFFFISCRSQFACSALVIFEPLPPAEKSLVPPLYPLRETRVCVLWFTCRTWSYYVLSPHCSCTPMWPLLSGSTWTSTWTPWPLVCFWNLGDNCLEYCIISFTSHLCLSPHFSDSTACHHPAHVTCSPLVLCSAPLCLWGHLIHSPPWGMSSNLLGFLPPHTAVC